jgi:hypothetical protein
MLTSQEGKPFGGTGAAFLRLVALAAGDRGEETAQTE